MAGSALPISTTNIRSTATTSQANVSSRRRVIPTLSTTAPGTQLRTDLLPLVRSISTSGTLPSPVVKRRRVSSVVTICAHSPQSAGTNLAPAGPVVPTVRSTAGTKTALARTPSRSARARISSALSSTSTASSGLVARTVEFSALTPPPSRSKSASTSAMATSSVPSMSTTTATSSLASVTVPSPASTPQATRPTS